MKALIVVDMQYDFIDGSLAVPGAAEIILPIQERLRDVMRFKDGECMVALTACDHPKDHCSFEGYGGKWPAHCVQMTSGADVQIGIACMAALNGWHTFRKGQDVMREEYSALYEGSELRRWLQTDGWGAAPVDEIEICGLARDYCVQATYEEAVKLGFKAKILEPLCRSVEIPASLSEQSGDAQERLGASA